MMLAAVPMIAQQRRTAGTAVPPGTSTIRGQVLDSISKTPIAGCTLRISSAGLSSLLVSDQDGAFELKDVVAADYFFLIQCPSHLHSCVDPETPSNSCRRIAVARDQLLDDVKFFVTPGAIARGQVMTAGGRPVTNATVRLGRGIKGEATPLLPGRPAITDTDGRFELTNLPAGEWRLEVDIAPVPGGLRPPTVYYPGGLSWEDAIGVELHPGLVKDDLIITVPRINENALSVAVPPPDATISDVVVSVVQQSPLVTRRVALNAEGIGELKGVLPGRYFVLALASSGDTRWAGFEVVDFIEDSYQARLHLLPTGSIEGRVVSEKGDAAPVDGVLVGASWIHDGSEINPLVPDEVRANADGTFRIVNLFGTRKLQVRGLGSDWEVAAIRQDHSDVTISGITIVPGETIEATIVLRRR